MSPQLLFKQVSSCLPDLSLLYCSAAAKLLPCMHFFFPSPLTTSPTAAASCGLTLCFPKALCVICIDHSLCSHLLPYALYTEWWAAEPWCQNEPGVSQLFSVSAVLRGESSGDCTACFCHDYMSLLGNIYMSKATHSPHGFCFKQWSTAHRLRRLREHRRLLILLD